jgi:hypothetical protein
MSLSLSLSLFLSLSLSLSLPVSLSFTSLVSTDLRPDPSFLLFLFYLPSPSFPALIGLERRSAVPHPQQPAAAPLRRPREPLSAALGRPAGIELREHRHRRRGCERPGRSQCFRRVLLRGSGQQRAVCERSPAGGRSAQEPGEHACPDALPGSFRLSPLYPCAFLLTPLPPSSPYPHPPPCPPPSLFPLLSVPPPLPLSSFP